MVDENLTSDLNMSKALQAQGLPAKLVVVGGPNEGAEVTLSGLTVVGTDPECSLVLDDPTVSRKHVSISLAGSRIRVEDLGSRNGTFLGDARVVEAEVRLGSVLTLGKSAVAIQPRWHLREVPPSSSRNFGTLVGESLAMREVFAILERISPTQVTVLIEGESGTGKELVCRSIHKASLRSGGPYMVFDCGSVPRELAESELFGHKKGAFTGASDDREGIFQQANGGTICLDEIGELPIELQSRLLRVLETGEIRRVGDDRIRNIDVRVLAATNRDLHAEARADRFRSDLLYRLEVVRVRVPPLRQRPEDIPGLVKHFLGDSISDPEEVGSENLRKLVAYSWPGNVRELRNTISRAVALARRPAGKAPKFSELVFNLGPEMPTHTIGSTYPGVVPPLPFKEAKSQLLAGFEHAYVEALLARHKGNISQAAEAAGLSRKHLYELIRRTVGEIEDKPES
jgi:DNA-binding NtrC family response regulator